MLAKIVVSFMFLMGLSAVVFGSICLGMGVKESYKSLDWSGFFGALAVLMLFILLGAGLSGLWIFFLVKGG